MSFSSNNTLVTNIQGYSIHDGPGIRTIVFTKGCSLACRWCCNPECISSIPELSYNETLCTRCGKCLKTCPNAALTSGERGQIQLNHQLCKICGECSTVCDYKALVRFGKSMSVQEVFDVVSRDNMFFQSSGGGVTISGGEPLLHLDFTLGLSNLCHQGGINTCIETAGNVNSNAFQKVLPTIDFILFDIKHLNSEKHRQFTGHSNLLILENAKLVAQSGVGFLFRMPLIPGINDDMQNIEETAAFLRSLGRNAQRIELMPFHRLGENKYKALGKRYQMEGFMPPEPEYVQLIQNHFKEKGIKCSISM